MRAKFGTLPPGTTFLHSSTQNHPGLQMLKLSNPENWAGRDKHYQPGEDGAQLNAVCLTDGVPAPIGPNTEVIVIHLPNHR